MERGRGEKKEYWFMRLREKFFDDRELKEIEALDEALFVPNFCYLVEVLYMKLMCYSIRDEGELYFVAQIEGARDIADCIIAMKFFPESKKAQIRQALAILSKLNLIYVELRSDETRIYIPEVENMTGRSTKRADDQRKIDRKRRLKQIDDERRLICSSYGVNGNVYLTEEEYADISDRAEKAGMDLQRVIQTVSIKKYAKGGIDMTDYEACLIALGEKNTALVAKGSL